MKKLPAASWIHSRVRKGHSRIVVAKVIAVIGMVFATLSFVATQSAHLASASLPAFTLPDGIPDFSQDTSRPSLQSTKSGRWADPTTWGGQLPTANHVVRVLQGHTVTIDDTAATAYTVVIDGKLSFAPMVDTRLKATNIEVMAGNNGDGTPGLLEIGTTAAPIAPGSTAEIVISNTPTGGSVPDPEQFGTGILVFGKITMNGSVRTPTFVRVSSEPRAGSTTLALSQAVSGWRVGDRLVLPDTRHIKASEVTGGGWINAVNQWEERTVQAISADGLTVTLNAALQYDHLGARDLNGVLDFLPHVGNLTRNVIVRSESATGTRGHLLATHHADVDIRNALFKDLGRTTYLPLDSTTNHEGRYPIYTDDLSGPLSPQPNGYQYTLIGNAIDGGSAQTTFKWGIAISGTDYGYIHDNVVYNYNGAAIVTETGSESFNVFDHNFTMRGMGEPTDSTGEARLGKGTEGVGLWFRGPNNYVTNNVAANYQNPTTEASYGFVYQFRFLGNINVPNFQGADTTVAGQFTTKNGNNMPILLFQNNEAYGAMQGGFTLWWVSSQDPQPYSGAQESVIKDLKVWNAYNKAVYMYPAQKVTFDGLKIRGSFSSLSRCCGNGVYFADYSSKGIIIRNSDIQGMEQGITAPESGFGPEPQLTVENSYLRNNFNLQVPTVGSVNGCTWMPDKLVVASNTLFAAPPGRSLSAIAMVRDVANATECLTKLDQMRVYAFNGNANDNFQVYHTNTSVLPRPPAGCAPTTRPEINGLLCPIAPQGAVPPTASLSAAPTSIADGALSILTWNTTNATTVTIDQGIGAVAASGTRAVSPAATTTYTLTATNAVGSVTATATVTVTAPAPALAISGVVPTNVTSTAATITWTTSLAASSRVDYGTTTAYGTFAADATQVTDHSVALTGLTPGTTYHYRVTSQTSTDSASTGDLTFTTVSALPGVTFSASPATIASGASSTLTWIATNAMTVTIDNGIGTVAASGSRSVAPTATTTYTLTATNSAGSTTATATVTVTAASDTTPPTVVGITPAAGATGVSTAASVTATFSEAMMASTITTTTFALRDAANVVVPATVSYDASTRVATLKPSQALAAATTYAATITGRRHGVTDLAGNPLAGNLVWSFTTATATAKSPVTIWSDAATPAGIATSDVSALELGLRFKSDVNGTVTGVRFYKGLSSTGTHTGTLWSSRGTRLATATFTDETSSGWQQVNFSTPVAITANTVYVVSYHTSVGNYAYSSAYFASAGVDAAPLHALPDADGGNGVFRRSTKILFPKATYNATNYWVDVVFVPQ
jgi:hypothetical protein